MLFISYTVSHRDVCRLERCNIALHRLIMRHTINSGFAALLDQLLDQDVAAFGTNSGQNLIYLQLWTPHLPQPVFPFDHRTPLSHRSDDNLDVTYLQGVSIICQL